MGSPASEPFQNPWRNRVDIVKMLRAAETSKISVCRHDSGSSIFQGAGQIGRVIRIVAELPGQVESPMQHHLAHWTILDERIGVQEVSEGLFTLRRVTVPLARHNPVRAHRHNIQHERNEMTAQPPLQFPGDV